MSEIHCRTKFALVATIQSPRAASKHVGPSNQRQPQPLEMISSRGDPRSMTRVQKSRKSDSRPWPRFKVKESVRSKSSQGCTQVQFESGPFGHNIQTQGWESKPRRGKSFKVKFGATGQTQHFSASNQGRSQRLESMGLANRTRF